MSPRSSTSHHSTQPNRGRTIIAFFCVIGAMAGLGWWGFFSKPRLTQPVPYVTPGHTTIPSSPPSVTE